MLNIVANKAGKEAVMTTESRETKVLVILGASITLGAVILNILGHNPPSAGAFCLSRYYRLGSVKKAIYSRAVQFPGRWSRVEIYFSGTESGCIEQLASSSDVSGDAHINPIREAKEKVSPDRDTAYNGVNCHFVICNGNGGRDGQIQATEKWQRQSTVGAIAGLADKAPIDKTIYICVIADNKVAHQTDFQIKRTEALVEELSRKFNIQPESIHYPDDWQ